MTPKMKDKRPKKETVRAISFTVTAMVPASRREEEGRGGKKREVELRNGLVRMKRKMYFF